MKASTAKIRRCRDCPDCEISRINNPQGHCTRLDKGLYAGVWIVDRNCPWDDTLDAEMCLIDGGCHPDCQHMQHCIRCGPCCKAVRDKLMVEDTGKVLLDHKFELD